MRGEHYVNYSSFNVVVVECREDTAAERPDFFGVVVDLLPKSTNTITESIGVL